MKMKAIVLAAGKGTRLQTEGCDLPKVMREACGKPLLHYVLSEISFIPKEDTVIVVGYKKDDVIARFFDYSFAEQREQLGTGHAVMAASDALEGFSGSVLICYGDMPLLTRETYTALIDAHTSSGNDCTILTGTSEGYLPYGRIVRDENGGFLRMVEDKDCTPEEKEIKELNVGVYVFNAEKLLPVLSQLKNNNVQGEYYLTDAPIIMRELGDKIGIVMRELGSELIGVNTVDQLNEVEDIISARDA